MPEHGKKYRAVIEANPENGSYQPRDALEKVREMAFAKFEAFPKKAAAHTIDDFWNAIAEAIESFTPTECENYFATAGYDHE